LSRNSRTLFCLATSRFPLSEAHARIDTFVYEKSLIIVSIILGVITFIVHSMSFMRLLTISLGFTNTELHKPTFTECPELLDHRVVVEFLALGFFPFGNLFPVIRLCFLGDRQITEIQITAGSP
jgi:hypothetical protein